LFTGRTEGEKKKAPPARIGVRSPVRYDVNALAGFHDRRPSILVPYIVRLNIAKGAARAVVKNRQ
jgi:hypothetical protein